MWDGGQCGLKIVENGEEVPTGWKFENSETKADALKDLLYQVKPNETEEDWMSRAESLKGWLMVMTGEGCEL